MWGTGRPRAPDPFGQGAVSRPGGALARRGALRRASRRDVQVSRQTVYNWVNRFLRRDDLELRARLLDAPRPGRPLRSPRSSTPGLRRPSLAIPASRVIMPRSGPPSCCSTTWSTLMGSRPPSRASAWRSHAWVSAGNGPGMSWRHGRRPGAKQKGAETRPEGSHAQGNLDAGRDDRHGDTSAV